MSEFYLRMLKFDTEKMQKDLSRIADSLENLTALFEKEFSTPEYNATEMPFAGIIKYEDENELD